MPDKEEVLEDHKELLGESFYSKRMYLNDQQDHAGPSRLEQRGESTISSGTV